MTLNAPESSRIPRVSVVIPAYNAQRYLAEAVRSTLAQTFDDFECIVVDDGSTDRTPALLAELARQDSRVRPLPVAHGGIVDALNAGVRAVRGELVARMDADDVCLPERFSRQVAYLDSHPQCVAVGSKVMLVDPFNSTLWEIDVKLVHEGIDAALLRGDGWAMFHPAAMIRRQAMLDIGGYRAEYQWVEDIDLFLRLGEIGRLANLPEPLLRYRQHFSSVNRTRLQIQLDRTRQLLTETFVRRGLPLPADFKLPTGPKFTPYQQIRNWALEALSRRNLPVARRHAWAALRLEPSRRDSWSLMYHAMVGK